MGGAHPLRSAFRASARTMLAVQGDAAGAVKDEGVVGLWMDAVPLVGRPLHSRFSRSYLYLL